jgi:hypothetical protein
MDSDLALRRGSRLIALLVIFASAASTLFLAPAAGTPTGGRAVIAQPRLSKQEFLARGNLACRRSWKKLYSLPQPRSLEEYIAQLTTAIKLFHDLQVSLRRLRPPKSLERLVNQMLVAFAEAGKTLTRAREAARRGDRKGMEAALKAGAKPANHAGDLAIKVGLKDCTLPW